MSEKVRTIRLYGKLGARFGRVHRLAVQSPREAVRALCALLPGFEAFMMNAKDKGMSFSIFVGSSNINEDQLEHPVGRDDIRIAPVLIGSKRAGLFQMIAGIVLVVVGGFISGWTFGAGAGIGGPMMMMGISMIVGGVVQMLSPQPKGLGARDSGGNQSSYSFNGAVNTQAQGNPVPLLYGRLIVGSAVISAGIQNVDVYVPVAGKSTTDNPWGSEPGVVTIAKHLVGTGVATT